MYLASLAATFSYLWLGWIVGFVIIELIALRIDRKRTPENYDDGTLSSLIWRVTRRNKLFGIIFGGLWIVLTYHFFFQQPL